MKKNNIKLLPYIREDLHGLNSRMPAMIGWEISDFGIQNFWKETRGENVTVAVIDTGVDINHEDLKNNIIDGINFVNPSEDPIDRCGHGTHVSSTIAAEDNGHGIVGIANKTKIMPIKSLDDNGSGNMENVVKGIIYAADRGVDFITMSLGSDKECKQIEDAINYANKKGCIIFCAAGNSGERTDILYPAKYDKTISIGAIDRRLNRTNFTCSGETLDFLAPGHDIIGCVPGNNYAMMSGTSMSNPYAVGLACLLLSFNKRNKNHKLNDFNDYINIMKKNCRDLEEAKYKGIKKYQGYGILYPIL